MRRSLAVFWIFAGSMHFLRPKIYEPIMPRSLQRWNRELIYASGAAELAGGLMVIPAATRPAARWLLLATLAGVYPANIQMAINAERYKKIPSWALWARLPLQFAFAAHVWTGTK